MWKLAKVAIGHPFCDAETLESGQLSTYHILGRMGIAIRPKESSSYQTAIGQALIGKATGDTAGITWPKTAIRKVEIVEDRKPGYVPKRSCRPLNEYKSRRRPATTRTP